VHKRENVVSYLAKSEQASWRRRCARYDRPTTGAKAHCEAARRIEADNQSGRRELAEGPRRPDASARRLRRAGRSFKTTNCIESANALVEERCAKVDSWQTRTSGSAAATALLDIEPRLRGVRAMHIFRS